MLGPDAFPQDADWRSYGQLANDFNVKRGWLDEFILAFEKERNWGRPSSKASLGILWCVFTPEVVPSLGAVQAVEGLEGFRWTPGEHLYNWAIIGEGWRSAQARECVERLS